MLEIPAMGRQRQADGFINYLVRETLSPRKRWEGQAR